VYVYVYFTGSGALVIFRMIGVKALYCHFIKAKVVDMTAATVEVSHAFQYQARHLLAYFCQESKTNCTRKGGYSRVDLRPVGVPWTGLLRSACSIRQEESSADHYGWRT